MFLCNILRGLVQGFFLSSVRVLIDKNFDLFMLQNIWLAETRTIASCFHWLNK